MPDQHDVKIIQWPKQKALLEHYFKLDEPCPVSIIFDEKPAYVKVGNDREGSFDVDMNMKLTAVEDIPLCIKICEPICAVSDYTVGIQFLGRPLASINVRGTTKLGPCDDKPPLPQTCFDFSKLDPKKNSKVPLTVNGIQFTPLNSATTHQFTTMGEPTGQQKLRFPNEGMRLDFPQTVTAVEMTVVNFGNPVIQVNAFNNSNLVSTQTEMIQDTTSTIEVQGNAITAIEIKGGSNDAALVEVCFSNNPNAEPVVIIN